MGNLLAKMVAAVWNNGALQILMVGLQGAGKTTLLYRLKLGEVVTVVPTFGFHVDTVACKKVNFTVFDLQGSDKMWQLWRQYYKNKDGLIFVVDSNDRERVMEARNALFRILAEDDLHGAPLLVLANKLDLPNSMSAAEITDKLGLHSVHHHLSWYLSPTCAANGEGLYEGLEWLADAISRSRS